MSTRSTGSVAVLGLGNMGTALASALVGAGLDVTVWNRTPARAARFAGRASISDSAAGACSSADTVAVCLYDHASVMHVLGDADAAGALSGKTVIQFTTDTSQEADLLAGWAADRGISVLGAAIHAYPGEIGTDRAIVAYSGTRDLYEKVRPIREAFGGASFHVGERAGAASVIDVAVLGVFYASAISYFQGAALCQREGVDIGAYAALLTAWLPTVSEMAESSVPVLLNRAFAKDDQARLELHRLGADHVRSAAIEAGLQPDFSNAIVETFDRAIERGHREHELPAVIDGLTA